MKFKLIAAFLFLVSLSVSAQQKSNQNSDVNPADVQPLDDAIHHGYLPNGLAYYVRKNQTPKKRAVVYLVERAGSLQEDDNQLGLAHFTEHMAFNGTRDFPKNQLIDYLQKSGVKFGADVNAHTGFNQTIYELTLPTDSVQVMNKGLDMLLNWAGYISFAPEEVNKERGIIREEARIRQKSAIERMGNQTRPVELNNSRYAQRLPIGTEDIIKNCTPEELKHFYQDWYRPDEEAVIVVGDINPNKIVDLIKEKFGVLQNPAKERALADYAIPPAAGTQVKILTDPEAQYTEFSMTVRLPGTKMRTNAEYLQKTCTILLNKMLNDRFKEIARSGNPPFLYAGGGNASSLGNTDVFTIRTIAKPGELEKATKALLAEIERARKFGFTNEEFANAKRWYLNGRFSSYTDMANHKSELYAQEYSRNFLLGEGCPGLEYEYNFSRDNLGKVNLSYVNYLMIPYTSDQNRYIIVEAPEKDKANLPDKKTVLDWVNNPGKDVQAYADVKVDKDIDILSDSELKPGKIESDASDGAIGTETLTLSNGAKVILKKTNFHNGQILFDTYGFGGTSLAPDAEYPSAVLSAALVRRSGLANFNQVELDKFLTNKGVSLLPYVNTYYQGVSGSATRHDFELALKLIHLYFTAPKKDPTVWEGLLSEQRSFLATKDNSPAGVFADTVNAVLHCYNYRSMGFNKKMLQSATIDKAYDFYQGRFADASNFTFIFVGNLDDIGIRGLIKKYIGSLPSTHSNETYKDRGMYPVAGKVTKVVRKGIDDKSTVELVFSGQFEYSQNNNLQLKALGEILQIKLLERLREQENGVYSPRATTYCTSYPNKRYTVTIQFTCGPDNVDKLIAATMDEIGKIRKDGAQLTDIEKFKAQETRVTQVNLKENGFWLSHLASTSLNQGNPDYIVDYLKRLDDVTAESSKESANKYLSDNLVELILLPEKK
ncbi:MAG: insulinase family protein [Mucilaginibacter sp.]|nr:insulinase family protein [Mucilaginibacter sp.]